MNNKSLVVVGDKFNEFAESKQTITLSQLETIVKMPSKLFVGRQTLVAGLGCRLDHYHQIIAGLDENGLSSEHLDITSLRTFYDDNLTPNQFTHQKSTHNVLIGQAIRRSADRYELPFIIDERCVLMGDHQTGSHVQGMVITEAFRQTFIAITEEFYLADNGSEKYFVINDMNVEFMNFLFPLPAQIRFELINMDANDFRTRMEAKMILEQNGQICATMKTKFVVYPASYIRQKEKEMAGTVLSSYLTKQPVL
jgi:A-factor biosynthesis repeat.